MEIKIIDLRTPDLRKAKPGTIVITSKGYEFIRQDSDEEIWLDVASGLRWCDIESEKYTHRQAVDKFGNRLPTIEEFIEAEKHGFREVLPNMEDRWFWSSSLGSYNTYFARFFVGSDGSTGGDVRYYVYFGFSVRCVAR